MQTSTLTQASAPVPGEQVVATLERNLSKRPSPSKMLAYVHIPFCTSKCTFCDWVKQIPSSELQGSDGVHVAYANAIARQMQFYGEALLGTHYDTRLVYWGGGTPTKLCEQGLEIICQALQEHVLKGAAPEEYSVECSPETATESKLRILRSHGATRLSMGVQSFDDAELKFAGRAHRVPQVLAALENARRAGFSNINIDLIAGLPGQELATLMKSVEMAVACELPHISIYHYRATAGTAMVRQVRNSGKQMPRANHVMTIYEAARGYLFSKGYIEYCIGYFCRGEGLQCKCDLYYYELEGDYFGYGSGAYSILGGHYLYNVSNNMQRFVEDPTAFDIMTPVTSKSLARQFGALSPTISTPLGMTYERFERLYGLPFATVKEEPVVKSFIEYYESCGAEFVMDHERLYVTAETRTLALVNATSQIALMS